MTRRGLLVLAAGVFLLTGRTVATDTPIAGGESLKKVLEPDSVDTEFYVPVPEGATHLEVMLEGKRPKVDVDLYLRYAEPFVMAAPQSGQLLEGALYRSVGPNNVEFLDITFASSPPVSPGRWYLGLVNLDAERRTEVTVTVSVRSEAEPTLEPLDIQVVYSDPAGSGFKSNAPWPNRGQGGNNASTLGQARKNAFEKAVEILEASFTSPVPVVVEAVFDDFEENEDGGTPLASAGPSCFARDFPGAPVANTWYAQPIVPRLAGTDFFRAGFKSFNDAGEGESAAGCFAGSNIDADLTATFNTSPPGNGWWYGLSAAAQAAQGFDFVSVAVHEILHGMGYLSLTDISTGAKFAPDGVPRSDIFTDQLFTARNNGKLVAVNDLGRQQRLNAYTSNGNLLWLGELGDTVFWPANREALNQRPQEHPFMYSPGEPRPGSSVSHTFFKDIMYFQGTQEGASNSPVDLRGSGPNLGSAYYFLRDAGWGEDTKDQLEGPVGAAVPRGMWFDRARNGHGFDLQRVGDNWFLVFFTYDDEGNPEWYLAVGTLENNVFTTDANGLQRFTWDESDPDGDGTPLTAETVGDVELAFEATPETAACDDGVDRGEAIALARFSWTIHGQQGDWCAEPLPLPGMPPSQNFTGHWYAGSGDSGWGMTIYQRERNDGTQVLVDTLYFFDADGNPRWNQGVQADFINSHGNQTIDMRQFDGYARTSDCAPETCTVGEGASAGLMRLRLKEPIRGSDAGSRVTIDVDYLGMEGGPWKRNFAPIEMLSDPS